MLNILISAYAVSPSKGSEPGVGWNWIINLSENCNLFIITEGEWRIEIEKALESLPQKDNIHFYYNPLPSRIRKMCWNQGDWRFYWYYRKWQKQTFEIANEIIKSHHIDVIHQLNMIGFREPGYLWKIKNIPFVWGPIGGMELVPTGYLVDAKFKQRFKIFIKNRINNWQRKYYPRVLSALKRADFIIAANKGAYDIIHDYHKRPVTLINETGCYPNTPDQLISNKDIDDFNIVWVGRFIFTKQLGLALKIVASLTKTCNIKFHIIGSGADLTVKEYKLLVSKLGIEKYVIWHGEIPHNEVLKFMEQCDIFLFTSIMEGTPHVVLEALQSNLPIVCFDACGQAGVVDDSIGIKIPLTNTSQSIKDFTEAIEYLYNNHKALAMFRSHCFVRQQQLSWNTKAKQMIEIYKSVINKH